MCWVVAYTRPPQIMTSREHGHTELVAAAVSNRDPKRPDYRTNTTKVNEATGCTNEDIQRIFEGAWLVFHTGDIGQPIADIPPKQHERRLQICSNTMHGHTLE
jgi:hypothetical protein